MSFWIMLIIIAAQALYLYRLRTRLRMTEKSCELERQRKRRYCDEINNLRASLLKFQRDIGKLLVALTVICCLGSTAAAQVQSIVSNGQLQNRDFTLLLIHGNDQTSGQVLSMFAHPQSARLQEWSQGLHLRPMHVSEPFVAQHHQDLLHKHQNQLPIVALVDQSGGVWWSAAGGQIPTTEPETVRQLADAYAGTLAAFAKSPPPQRPMEQPAGGTRQPARAQSIDFPATPAASRFIDRGVMAPDPIRILSGPSGYTDAQPPIHPQPASEFDSSLLLVGALCVVCSLILAASPVIGSAIIAGALTDNPDDQ